MSTETARTAAVPTSLPACAALDAADPLAHLRERFVLPDGVIYLDGNSLGALPAATAGHLRHVIEDEWGQGLIRSWNDAGWFDKPRTLGDRVGALIGAAPGQVVVGDTTSVNVFKTLMAAAGLRPGRHTIVGDLDNFPTDLYIAQGVAELLGGYRLRNVSSGTALSDVLDDDVAVVLLTEVDYRTGRRYDMRAVTEQVHAAGALVIWDLCHSAGAMPVDLDGCEVDLAVGCTYKYLNGGPGSPAYTYVAARHQDAARSPLTGWHGHHRPFAFTPDYQPAQGIGRFAVGTPHLLSFAALEASLVDWADVDLLAVRAKSLALTQLFIELVEARCDGVRLATPRETASRGSQVSFRHADGYAVVQALVERGVIGDFRAPDIMRFGFAAPYVRYVDVWHAADALADVLERETWRGVRYAVRAQVT